MDAMLSDSHSSSNSALDVKALIQSSLKLTLARDPLTATKRDWWLATSKAVQGVIVERMLATPGLITRRMLSAFTTSRGGFLWDGSFPTLSKRGSE